MSKFCRHYGVTTWRYHSIEHLDQIRIFNILEKMK